MLSIRQRRGGELGRLSGPRGPQCSMQLGSPRIGRADLSGGARRRPEGLESGSDVQAPADPERLEQPSSLPHTRNNAHQLQAQSPRQMHSSRVTGWGGWDTLWTVSPHSYPTPLPQPTWIPSSLPAGHNFTPAGHQRLTLATYNHLTLAGHHLLTPAGKYLFTPQTPSPHPLLDSNSSPSGHGFSAGLLQNPQKT